MITLASAPADATEIKLVRFYTFSSGNLIMSKFEFHEKGRCDTKRKKIRTKIFKMFCFYRLSIKATYRAAVYFQLFFLKIVPNRTELNW